MKELQKFKAKKAFTFPIGGISKKGVCGIGEKSSGIAEGLKKTIIIGKNRPPERRAVLSGQTRYESKIRCVFSSRLTM